MSKDLVKRARDCANGLGDTKTDRGDLGIFDDLADRIEELEAKLAKALEGFEELACLGNGDRHGNSFGNLIAQEYIAELTGGKDE